VTVQLPDLLARVAGLRVAVLGDAMLDVYLHGEVSRLCREAPAPVVAIQDAFYAPGGAANAASNIQTIGGQALFIACVGEDSEGQRLQTCLHDKGVSTEYMLVCSSRETLSKQRLIAHGHTLARFDMGTTTPLDSQSERGLLSRLDRALDHCDAVLVSDYAYGTITDAVVLRLQSRRVPVLVVDARTPARYRTLAPTAVKPNLAEAMSVLGMPGTGKRRDQLQQLLAARDRLLMETGASICAVTLDLDGALVFERDQPTHRVFARPFPASHATGAGDTFAAALSLALCAGVETPSAAEFASAAAQIVLNSDGTVTCRAAELGAIYDGEPRLVRG
jgi:D-beta-D-heptose 7-phosphate kinase/D-beta-D-heptose 1-phosphate adenosyltransferase